MDGTELLFKDFTRSPYVHLIDCSANSVNISENCWAKNIFMKDEFSWYCWPHQTVLRVPRQSPYEGHGKRGHSQPG